MSDTASGSATPVSCEAGKGRVITMSAELLEQAMALAQVGKQVKAEIVEGRSPIVAA